MSNVAAMFASITAAGIAARSNCGEDYMEYRYYAKEKAPFHDYPFVTRWRLRYMIRRLRSLSSKRSLTRSPETAGEAKLWIKYFELLEKK